VNRLNDHPYREFLHRVNKPARYTGGEFQSRRKDWSTVDLRYALAFPDLYDIGMSHLGTKILYKIVNDLDWACGERVFAPWPDLEAEIRERKLPLISLESSQPLHTFDVIGFSLQYELTYTNLLNMLDLGGVAIRNADRAEAAPFVIAGGPTATHPEPLAPFVDAFVIGDGEETLVKVLEIIRDGRSEGASRREILVRLAANGAVYCPDLYATEIDPDGGFEIVGEPVDPRVPKRVVRHIVDDINAYPFPDDAPVAAAEAIFDRMSIEIARGCTEGCRFCQAGMIYRPVRERDPDQVIDTVLGAINNAGYDEVSLTTLSTADYSCISPLIRKLNERLKSRDVSMSVASLRAYGLAEDLLEEIGSIRASSLTFAPEAGTQRMRDVVNKNVTEENLHTTAHRVFSRNWNKVKCYFMIGLPTEEDEDVDGIVDTSLRMREIGRLYKRDAEVTVSVSSHVPKPHTPFQWARMDSPDEITAKQDRLYHLCRSNRLRLRRHDARTSYLEGVVGRGDRRVADAVEGAWRRGARFDGWDEHLAYDAWMQAFAEAGIDPELYLGRLREDIKLPWDHIDVGLADGFLRREWKRAVKGRLSPPCGKPVGMQVHHTNVQDAAEDQRKLVCYHCGVACDMAGMRQERIDYLDQLGALDRLDVALPEDQVDTEVKDAWKRPKKKPSNNAKVSLTTLQKRVEEARKQPRPKAPPQVAKRKIPRVPYSGPVFRYRIQFSKDGAEALTSHLDLVRSMPRMIRRAGLPVRYSDGFHPKPVMSFSPALPLGATARGELMDIDLVAFIEPGELHRRLSEASTEGLRILAVEHVPLTAPRLTATLQGARYRIGLRPLNGPVASNEISRGLWTFLAAGSWVSEVQRRRKPRFVDLRRDVVDLHLDADGSVLLHMRVSETASGRPHEIVDAALAELKAFAPVEPPDIERVEWVRVERDGSGVSPTTARPTLPG